jgi:cell division protein FtsI (penicillin-binding protein 3)
MTAEQLTPVRLEGQAKQIIDTGRTRLLVTAAVFAFAFFAVSVRLAEVTLISEAEEPRVTHAAAVTKVQTTRADIRDRNGLLLATNLTTASLYANPRVIINPDDAAAKLARVLPDVSGAALAQKLKSDRGFVWIKRHLTPRQQYAVNRLGIPGVDFQRDERRIYPAGPLAAHVIGMTDIDNKGLAGVERYFDEEVRSRSEALYLSIDSRVQHIATSELQRAMTTFKAIGAAGLVLDVQTGEIISMVSLPSFDPNDPGSAPGDTRFNRPVLGVYEMGSTFKIFTTAMALDSGVTSMTGGYDASRPIQISRFTIRDYHGKNRWLTVPEIFVYSSNIGSARMALDVGGPAQRAFLGKLGMLQAVPVELSEVGAPLVPQVWRDINTMTIAFGHGLAVSPLHLAAGVAAIVNGGIYHNPTLLRRDSATPPEGRRVISAKTSREMRRLMLQVVENGTGKMARADGYLVGGKTGTAEKAIGHHYRQKALLSSFIGAFPMNEPRYLVLAMLDEPQGNKETMNYATGGWVAAPIVANIVKRSAPILGVAPIDESAPDIRRDMLVQVDYREGARASR